MPSHYATIPAGGAISRVTAGLQERTSLQSIRDALLQRLSKQAAGPIDPFNSPLYQSGIGSLRDLLGDQRTRDEGRASAVGLPGSEIGKAAGANRLRALTEGQRGLLGQATQAGIAQRGQAQNSLLSLLGLLSVEEQAELNRDQRDKESQRNLFGQLGSAGVALIGGGFG